MEIYEGLYWAKLLPGEEQDWSIVFVKGAAPFLSVWPIVINATGERWYTDMRPHLDITHEAKWHFGPRIEYPEAVTRD